MAEVAYPLHEEEIVALAHYLAHLKRLTLIRASCFETRARPRMKRSHLIRATALEGGSYFSASGCRSRTRLFSRSSTTWV